MMNISEAEAVVMEALWQRHPLSSEDLVAELGPRQDRKSTRLNSSHT